jgi:hypothetical protein
VPNRLAKAIAERASKLPNGVGDALGECDGFTGGCSTDSVPLERVGKWATGGLNGAGERARVATHGHYGSFQLGRTLIAVAGGGECLPETLGPTGGCIATARAVDGHDGQLESHVRHRRSS